MAKETAEQKLLKLIESTDKDSLPGQSDSSAGSPEAQKVLNSVKSVGLPAATVPPFLTNLLSFLKGQTAGKGAPPFGLREINRILAVLVVFIVLFFIKDFRNGLNQSSQEIDFSDYESVASLGRSTMPTWKDLSAYVTVVSRRNIFQPYEKKEIEVADAPEVNDRINQKVSGLKLVGISWLDSPESITVMVEDESTSVTHFLMAGDELRGVKIDSIYADRVTLSYQGETIDISLQ